MNKIEVLFHLYKDEAISAEYLRYKVRDCNLTVNETRDLFTRITNYQIKKYGGNRFYNSKQKGKSATY